MYMYVMWSIYTCHMVFMSSSFYHTLPVIDAFCTFVRRPLCTTPFLLRDHGSHILLNCLTLCSVKM